MQVEHLFIIVVTDEAADEAAKSGKALYDKKRAREPMSKVLVHIDTRTPGATWAGSKTQAGKKSRAGAMIQAYSERKFPVGCQLIEGSVAPGYSTSDNVGVYFVFHCSRNGVPIVFDFAYAIAGEMALYKKPDLVADQMTRILMELGLERMRKLCLVACSTAKPGKSAEHGFLGGLCKAMEKTLESPPMIAGWDNYLTVRADGRKLVGSAPEEQLASDYHEQKLIAEYKGGKYVFTRLEKSGWSDQHQAPTESGVTSSFL